MSRAGSRLITFLSPIAGLNPEGKGQVQPNVAGVKDLDAPEKFNFSSGVQELYAET